MFGRFSHEPERLRREAADWIARLEGEAGVADRESFRRWYEADPLHAQTYDRLKALYGSAGMIARTELGRGRDLRQAGSAAGPRRYAVAAGLAALLVVGGAVLLGRPVGLMPKAEAQTLLFATDVGEIRRVPLPDGSRMTLDSKSEVRVTIGGDLRQVTLSEGRARFVVEPGHERPFVVAAGPALVTGRAGTVDVDLIGGDSKVQTIEGTFSVEATARGAAAEPVRIAAGEVVLVPAQGEGIQERPAGRAAALWPTGRLEFAGTPLGQVVAEANRYSRGGIRLADPSLAALRVTGTFRAGDLEGLARSLEQAFKLRLDRSDDGQLVLYPALSGAGALSADKEGG